MRLAKTINGNISPKSVVASGDGHVIAQNMMYRHSITVYDRSYRLVKTISDRVDLDALGGPATGGPVRGAPVEAAFSPDARYAYVSNYSMYGPGYTREGSDRCSPGSAIDRSFVYRLDMGRLAVDRVGRVGQVPKYVAATPDGRLVLVTNWCSYDLSVLSPRTLKELRRVRLGTYPRGIAVDPAPAPRMSRSWARPGSPWSTCAASGSAGSRGLAAAPATWSSTRLAGGCMRP
jgi:YVTN family beta-propeller protein